MLMTTVSLVDKKAFVVSKVIAGSACDDIVESLCNVVQIVRCQHHLIKQCKCTHGTCC